MKHISAYLAALALSGFGAFSSPAFAQTADTIPPATGARVPQGYFGPSPSEFQKELIGPYKLMKSGQVDMKAMTVTLPLYKGKLKDGRLVWYIITDTDDRLNAEQLGLNWSAKMTYANVGHACRMADLVKDGDGVELVFDSGAVDFKPVKSLTPGDGPHPFPPKAAQPGSIGDKNYSPLVCIRNAGNHIYSAPIVAFDVSAQKINFPNGGVDHAIMHDKVVKCDPAAMTVTMTLTDGMSFARRILYLSTEVNDATTAVLEESTYAPALKDVVVGGDDSAFSAVERIFIFTNGPTGKGNPQRQGLDSAIADGGGPVNIFGGIQTIGTDYSPLWDANVGEWTASAIAKGYRSRLTEEFQILDFARKGFITGPKGAKYGSSGIVIICPPVMRLE